MQLFESNQLFAQGRRNLRHGERNRFLLKSPLGKHCLALTAGRQGIVRSFRSRARRVMYGCTSAVSRNPGSIFEFRPSSVVIRRRAVSRYRIDAKLYRGEKSVYLRSLRNVDITSVPFLNNRRRTRCPQRRAWFGRHRNFETRAIVSTCHDASRNA